MTRCPDCRELPFRCLCPTSDDDAGEDGAIPQAEIHDDTAPGCVDCGGDPQTCPHRDEHAKRRQRRDER